jgi:hypothetical protein
MFMRIKSIIEIANKPNGLTSGMLEELIICRNELYRWFVDSQNDCLRARGDVRWNTANDLLNKIETLLSTY